MTVEERYVVDLNDIRAIRIECTNCGTAVTFKAADWAQYPSQCPGCAVSWHHGDPSLEFQMLAGFAFNLRRLAADSTRTFRLRLELDRPKS